jgi:putative multiple sugar transport system ATP-binding protein
MIIKDMVGRDLTQRFPQRVSSPGETVMEVKNWTVYHPDYHTIKVVDNVSFFLKKGEILAFCGPMGAGRTELMMSIFGGSYGFRSEGELYIQGKAVNAATASAASMPLPLEQRSFNSAGAAIRSGLGYISEDRKNLGLVLIQDVKTNIALASLNKLSRFGIMDSKKEIREAERYRKELNIRMPSVNQIVRNLSGGNQQKVVVSKSLLADPDIFIIDEPTRGIDVGAKTEIYGILNNMIAAGKSVIMISSELPEALGMADRIYVMNEGKIKGALSKEEATQEKIMHMALVG